MIQVPAGVEEGQVAVAHQQSRSAAAHLPPLPAILRQQLCHEHRLRSEFSCDGLQRGRRMVHHRKGLQDPMRSNAVYEQKSGVAGLGGHPSIHRALGIRGYSSAVAIATDIAANGIRVRVAREVVKWTPVLLMTHAILILKSHVVGRVDTVVHVLLGAVEQLGVEYLLKTTEVVVVHNMLATVVVE